MIDGNWKLDWQVFDVVGEDFEVVCEVKPGNGGVVVAVVCGNREVEGKGWLDGIFLLLFAVVWMRTANNSVVSVRSFFCV